VEKTVCRHLIKLAAQHYWLHHNTLLTAPIRMSQKLTFKDKLLLAIVPPLATAIIKSLALTMKIEVLHEERVKPFWEDNKRMILAFWHGRLLMMPFASFGTKFTNLASPHEDGAFSAKTLTKLGITSVIGSSTRGWIGGFKGLLKAVKQGSSISMTPDGPKGPPRIAKTGTVQLASKTGLPIYPITFGSLKKKLYPVGIAS
ncbi:MAG: DUF374 domain-containing protein, partial [Deltaproteobacteria bacterium]|nr:DUF374 domain-containing protein [Deltaproteobacteria bacterium]